MESVRQLFADAKTLRDHPVHHPEGFLGRHIALVTLKAMLATNNVDLILAGLFHDICKPYQFTGEWIKIGSEWYWSNPKHPSQAAELVHNDDDTRYFIKSVGGNVDTVAGLCKYHMAAKDGIPRKGRRVPFLDVFPALDDMTQRIPFPECDGTFQLLDGAYKGRLTYIGQSPIQRNTAGAGFTITINRFPFTFEWEDLPNFFRGTPYYSLVKKLI
jgi:hypothetical protein